MSAMEFCLHGVPMTNCERCKEPQTSECGCKSVDGMGVELCKTHTSEIGRQMAEIRDGNRPFSSFAPKKDPVNPDHYKVNGLECVDVIEALGLGYHLGTALKYLWRVGRKDDALQDLKKCRWFVDRAIKNMEKK